VVSASSSLSTVNAGTEAISGGIARHDGPTLLPPATSLERRLRHQAPPIPVSPLIGRTDEVAALTALLRRPEVRLVTLTGTGGVGKTRLALAAAGALDGDFDDGVAFVDLAPVQDPALAGGAIAQALGMREAGDQPVVNSLIAHLRHRHLLLILDNVEHLLSAAPVVGDLLTSCSHLTVLATSRAPLRIDGERVVVVPPLPIPEPRGRVHRSAVEAVEGAAAGLLFVERVFAVDEGFALTERNAAAIAEICRRLDGLPLAIELAAARCLALSPEALLQRMDRRLPLLTGGRRDAPPRMRSLHEAIAWSYQLLSPDEQSVFGRLAVFTGGFTLEAAETVLAGMDGRALDVVTSLAAQSLLTRSDQPDGSVRFAMLETIREFAQNCLTASGEEHGIRRRHAEYYLRLTEDAGRVIPRPGRWWEPFEAEWGNLRAALAWTLAASETALGLHLGGVLFGYWLLRGQIGEGIAWLDQLLTAGADEAPALRSRVEMGLGVLLWAAGEFDRASALEANSRALADSAGDRVGYAACRFVEGLVAEARGDLASAAAGLTEAREIYESAAIATAAAAATAHLGRVVGRGGDRDAAQRLLLDAVAVLDRDDGGLWGAATAYGDLGLLVAESGERGHGAALVAKGLRLHAAIGDRLTFLVSLGAAAWIAARAEQEEAATLLGAVTALRAQSGPSVWAVVRPIHERAEALSLQALGDRRFRLLFDEGSSLGVEEAIAAALAVMERVTDAPVAPCRPPVAPTLSPRELAVLRLVATGLTDQEVADALGLRVRTVNTYVLNARRKLNAPSRAAAAAEIVRRGLA
jgi:predicted ATPase/DNA-binding CsgD family transcriptional regulator